MNGLLTASSRATAWATALSSSPAARRAPRGSAPTAVVLVAGALIVLAYGQQYTGSVFVLSACYAIVTAGMAVQIGFSQQIAFSQSVFFGVGAYGVAMLNTHLNMSVLLATVVMMVGAALVALLLGKMVTRASGLALAVATLMLPLIAVGYVSGSGYLGGAVGAPLTGTLWPSSASSTAVATVGGGIIVVVLLALVVFIAARILNSDIGLELFVLGVDERTAAALGVRTPRRKLELFVLGSVFAALGGAVYAGTQQFVPETVVDPTAELRREQERLAKLWQAYKLQEDELEQLRRERPVLMDTVAEQDKVIATLRGEQATLRDAAAYKEKYEETERRNRVLLIEVESLNRELRATTESLAAHEAELKEFRSVGATKESVQQLQSDLVKEQERLAKLYKVYEEQEAELKAAKAHLAKWESWFSRMEPAITALPKFFADAPRA